MKKVRNIPEHYGKLHRSGKQYRDEKENGGIYYYEEGETQRLRSICEIRDYCLQHDIKFEQYKFGFMAADRYEGIVHGQSGSSSAGSSPVNTPPHASIPQTDNSDI